MISGYTVTYLNVLVKRENERERTNTLCRCRGALHERAVVAVVAVV